MFLFALGSILAAGGVLYLVWALLPYVIVIAVVLGIIGNLLPAPDHPTVIEPPTRDVVVHFTPEERAYFAKEEKEAKMMPDLDGKLMDHDGCQTRTHGNVTETFCFQAPKS